MRRRLAHWLATGLLALCYLLGFLTPTFAATVIDYGPEPNALWWWRPEPNGTTIGQTFVLPNETDTSLTEFSFWVKSDPDYPYPARFRTYLAEWNGLGIAGAPLFTGEVQSTFFSAMTEIRTQTGGINLDPLKRYVIYLSAYGLYDGLYEAIFLEGHFGAIEYPNGWYVYDRSEGAAPGEVWTSPCSNLTYQANCAELAFRVALQEPRSVPEPGSFALAALGLTAIGFTRRRRH